VRQFYRHLRSLAGALAVVVVLAAPAAASPFVGANIDGAWRYPAVAQGRLLSTLHNAGFRIARFNVNWADVEPRRGVFDWSTLDQEMAAMAAAGLQPYPTLDETPAWDRVTASAPGPLSPLNLAPRSPGPFAAFVAALARRYGVHGSYVTARTDPIHIYEIWNEENQVYGYYPTSAKGYAALFNRARSALHHVDRRATVVLGGLASLWHSDSRGFRADGFAKAALAAIGRCPDSIGYHAYPLSVHGVLAAISDFRRVLDRAHCRRTSIELNEYNYVGRGEPAIAIATTATRILSARAGVNRFMMLPTIPPPTDPSDRGYATLIAPDATLTAVGRALSKVALASRSPRIRWPGAGRAAHR
jgi:hypothetical protein